MTVPGCFWLFDLDGTLSDADHRVHFAKAGDWDLFHAVAGHDKPRARVAAFFRAVCAMGGHAVIVTGRPERYRNPTVDWLDRHDLLPWRLLMRPDLDRRSDPVAKLELLGEFCREHWDLPPSEVVLAALEDRGKVVEAFRGAGIETWQVTEGKY